MHRKGGCGLRILLGVITVIAIIWLVPPFLSVESGLRFGVPYRVFFSFFTLFAGFLFYLLSAQALPPFKSAGRALGSAVLVFVASAGVIVLLANLAPQFTDEGGASTAATPQERGKAVFNDFNVGCFLCHQMDGSGGTRGPDLTHVASRAGNRRPGLSAEDYLKESLLNPSTFVVASYDNIMPPIAQQLPAEKFDDLIAFLMARK